MSAGAKFCGAEKEGVAIDGEADGTPEPIDAEGALDRPPDWNAQQDE